MSEHATSAGTLAPERDGGLRCPRCTYNLTGLLQPRCPECGHVFDWDEVRRAAANPPQIAFERARGWRKLPAFFVTWATVLFAPWVFARQAVKRVRTGHALTFAAVCFGGTFAAMLSGPASIGFMATWLTTAVLYLVMQAVWLSVLDFSNWRHPLATLRFWSLAGCYLSAVMLTEVYLGPPPLFISDLGTLLAGRMPSSFTDAMFQLSLPSLICWMQMLVWLAGLGCCYFARLRRRNWPAALLLPLTLLMIFGTLVLYAAVLEHIGAHLLNWYE